MSKNSLYTLSTRLVHSRLKSLMSEAIPSAIQFIKRAYKLAMFPDYKPPGLICLALPPRQKSDMILPFEVVLELKLTKNQLNKKKMCF